MSPQRLNLTAGAWRTMRRAWRPRPSPELLWQSYVTGPVLSWANQLQTKSTAALRQKADLRHALVIVGYWRSGTTLLHELLAASGRFNYPTTQACMRPQTFAMDRSGATSAQTIRRPMDDMLLAASSPQEDEFALLGLGARSPYEALLFPDHFAEALALADPDKLPPEERANWYACFQNFASTVSALQGTKPLLLKSPPHGERIAALRACLPNCKFAVVVRNPYEVFESTVRMWREMFACYALGPVPSDDTIRSIVLSHRVRYEKNLRAGLKTLPTEDFAIVPYEHLTNDAGAAVARLFTELQRDGANEAGTAAASEMQNRSRYKPKKSMPDATWRTQISTTWADIFRDHHYPIQS